jgi:hypothetical protein
MTWNYVDPLTIPRDEVRFLCGDTFIKDQLITDEEIAYGLSKFSSPSLAAALCLRSLAARASREVNTTVGEISQSASDRFKAYMALIDILDPYGITVGAIGLVIPSFGGLTHSGKDALDEDTDAVQPEFKRCQFDNPDIGSDTEEY